MFLLFSLINHLTTPETYLVTLWRRLASRLRTTRFNNQINHKVVKTSSSSSSHINKMCKGICLFKNLIRFQSKGTFYYRTNTLMLILTTAL